MRTAEKIEGRNTSRRSFVDFVPMTLEETRTYRFGRKYANPPITIVRCKLESTSHNVQD
jgi:hypothetical protein